MAYPEYSGGDGFVATEYDTNIKTNCRKDMKQLVLLVFVMVVGCSGENLDAPKKFFNGNKIGSSTDYGLMKWGDDHVATYHGFANDQAECMKAAETLNREACRETGGAGCLNPFSCKALNN